MANLVVDSGGKMGKIVAFGGGHVPQRLGELKQNGDAMASHHTERVEAIEHDENHDIRSK